jgi:hypothetical protein
VVKHIPMPSKDLTGGGPAARGTRRHGNLGLCGGEV